MRLEQFLLVNLRVGIALAVLTPLIVGPFGLSFTEQPKAFFLFMVVEVLLLLYLVLVVKNPSWLPRPTPILFFLAALWGIQAAAGALGFNPFRSFFGDFYWPQGIFFSLHLLALFFVGAGILQKKEEWMSLLKWTVFVGVLSSVAALLQFFDVFHFWGLYSPRVSGTLSNPVFFGSYILVSLFLAFLVLAGERNARWRIFWAAAALLHVTTLYLSGSRGAWFGAAIGFAVLFVWGFFMLKQRVSRRTLVVGGGAVFVAVGLLAGLLVVTGTLDDSLFVQRITESNAFSRITLWEAAVDAWLERPLLGWGPESFSYVFDLRAGGEHPTQTFANQPHNAFLEVLVETGILGFLAYLALFGAAGLALWRKSAGMPSHFKAAFVALLAAYLAQSLFIGDGVSIAVLLVVVFLGAHQFFLKERMSSSFPVAARMLLVPVALVLSAGTLAALWEVNLKPLRSNLQIVRGAQEEQRDFGQALLRYQRVLKEDTLFRDDFAIALTERLLVQATMPKAAPVRFPLMGLLSEGEAVLEQKLDRPDKMHRHYIDMLAGIKELRYGWFRSAKAAQEMELLAQQGLLLYPGRADLTFLGFLARSHVYQGEFEEAERAFARMLVLDPRSHDITFRLKHHLDTGLLYLRMSSGGGEFAAEHFRKRLELLFENPEYVRTISPLESLKKEAARTGEIIRFYKTELGDAKAGDMFLERALEVFPAEVHSILLGQK